MPNTLQELPLQGMIVECYNRILDKAVKDFIMAIPIRASDMRAIEHAFPPSQQRPDFDVPRFWSNPDLQDPVRITALVLERPTMEDLARTVVAYGARHVLDVLASLREDGEFTQYQYDCAFDLARSAIEGVADAARKVSNPFRIC